MQVDEITMVEVTKRDGLQIRVNAVELAVLQRALGAWRTDEHVAWMRQNNCEWADDDTVRFLRSILSISYSRSDVVEHVALPVEVQAAILREGQRMEVKPLPPQRQGPPEAAGAAR